MEYNQPVGASLWTKKEKRNELTRCMKEWEVLNFFQLVSRGSVQPRLMLQERKNQLLEQGPREIGKADQRYRMKGRHLHF